MLAKTEMTRIYETVLSIPGMGDNVKIALCLPRRNVLLLSKVIERGLSVKDTDDKFFNVLDMVPKENLQELLVLSAELLDKAGLTDTEKKLRLL